MPNMHLLALAGMKRSIYIWDITLCMGLLLLLLEYDIMHVFN